MKTSTRARKAALVSLALFAGIFSAGALATGTAEAAGWTYGHAAEGMKFYACKYSNTSGRIKVSNTTSSRKTFRISGSIYHIAAHGTTYVRLNKSYSFDVHGHNYSFQRSYARC